MNDVIQVRRLPITPQLRQEILERDNYSCRYCGSKTPPFHLDHVYPVSKGGETSKYNLVTSCSNCNKRKHNSIGMWPKPIGYFDDISSKPNISIMNVLLIAICISFAGIGYQFLDQFVLASKIFILIGISSGLFGLARISTGQ